MRLVKLMAAKNLSGPINLGNPKEFTILDLPKKTIQATYSKSKIIYRHLPADDPKQRRPDINFAKAKLAWQPKVPLEKGLLKTIDYFRKKLKIKA